MIRKIALCILIYGLCAASPSAQEVTCDIATEAIQAASRIRGLAKKNPVACYLKGQDEVKKFLLETIHEKIPRQRLEGEGFFYKAIGFIPHNFDYVNGLIELYTSQIGGYYDPDKNHYVMASWLPAIMQPAIAVHELTHALQDQYYNLDSFLDDEKYSTDELLARSALIEGDATAVMNDYQREIVGQHPIAEDANVDAIVMQTVLGSYVAQGLSQAPETLKHAMLFPYVSGLRFVHHHLKNAGYKKIDALFREPPQSTEEILHPEKYPARQEEFQRIPETAVQGRGKILHQDTMGEFFISTWLTAHIEKKNEGALSGSGWDGDRMFVIQKADGKKEIAWIIAWDDNTLAQKFAERAKHALSLVDNSPTDIFEVSQRGAEVLINIRDAQK